MALSSPHAANVGQSILCHYCNVTEHIQVVRISDPPTAFLERVVFPGQRLLFQAPEDSWLQVYSGDALAPSLEQEVLCQHLRVTGS